MDVLLCCAELCTNCDELCTNGRSVLMRRQRVAQFTNGQMCRLTEQVVFLEPYTTAANNRWTSPQLDDDVAVGLTCGPGLQPGFHYNDFMIMIA